MIKKEEPFVIEYYKGIVRLMLIILHDFPSFLA